MLKLSTGQTEASEIDKKIKIRDQRIFQLPSKPMKILAAPSILLQPNCRQLMDTTLID